MQGQNTQTGVSGCCTEAACVECCDWLQPHVCRACVVASATHLRQLLVFVYFGILYTLGFQGSLAPTRLVFVTYSILARGMFLCQRWFQRFKFGFTLKCSQLTPYYLFCRTCNASQLCFSEFCCVHIIHQAPARLPRWQWAGHPVCASEGGQPTCVQIGQKQFTPVYVPCIS